MDAHEDEQQKAGKETISAEKRNFGQICDFSQHHGVKEVYL